MIKIRDLCSVRIGHSFRGRVRHAPTGKVLVIQPRDISLDGRISFADDGPLRTDAPSPRLLRPNDVLLVNRGRFVSAVFDSANPGQWVVPSSVLVLSVKAPSVLPNYLACFFNSFTGQKMLRRHGELTTIPYIRARNLEEMEIPLPSLERQRSLAGLAEATTDHEILSRRKQAMYRAILSQEFAPQPPTAKKSIS